jgi:hypothetical protein
MEMSAATHWKIVSLSCLEKLKFCDKTYAEKSYSKFNLAAKIGKVSHA